MLGLPAHLAPQRINQQNGPYDNHADECYQNPNASKRRISVWLNLPTRPLLSLAFDDAATAIIAMDTHNKHRQTGLLNDL